MLNLVVSVIMLATLGLGYQVFAEEIHFNFVPKANIVEISAPQLEYEAIDKKQLLRLGSLKFDLSKFGIDIEARNAAPYLVVNGPLETLKGGKLEIISHEGKTLWTQRVNGTVSMLIPSQLEAELHALTQPLHACVTQIAGIEKIVLCTSEYRVNSAERMVLAPVSTKLEASLIINQEKMNFSGVYTLVKADRPTHFFVRFSSGISLEMISLPQPINLIDISKNEKGMILLVGAGAKPVDGRLNEEKGQWTLLLQNDLFIEMPGKNFGTFRYRLAFKSVPEEKLRPQVLNRLNNETYLKEVPLRISATQGWAVSSSQNRVESAASQDQAVWSFASPQKGEFNKSLLQIKKGDQAYQLSAEIYRGYSQELSLRMTGMAAQGKVGLVGELAYFNWFESLLGWENNYLSLQRWGAGLKYFRSISKLVIKDDANTETNVQMTVMNVNLKYRLMQGLWGKDEVVGPLLDYQKVDLTEGQLAMLGYGVYWARSMPQFFDRFLSYLPYMKSPKWVDMEFINYVVPLKGDATLRATYSVSFHGKIMWTPSFFGEAGFGFKKFDFDDASANTNATFASLFGTLGLGYNF